MVNLTKRTQTTGRGTYRTFTTDGIEFFLATPAHGQPVLSTVVAMPDGSMLLAPVSRFRDEASAMAYAQSHASFTVALVAALDAGEMADVLDTLDKIPARDLIS